ncbi:MAG: hypothetical protein QG635_2031 [Bacteroidota bacterium]|nr:hypothetical protein [Bacteroidota bacterium]
MKKIIIAIISLILPAIIFSQIEPSQTTFTFGSNASATFVSLDDPYFKLDNYLLGWHWGYPRRISQAELSDMNHFDTRTAYFNPNFADDLVDSSFVVNR